MGWPMPTLVRGWGRYGSLLDGGLCRLAMAYDGMFFANTNNHTCVMNVYSDWLVHAYDGEND